MKKLLLIAAGCLAFAAPAEAMIATSGSHATTLAANWQKNNCGDFSHICLNPFYTRPSCYQTSRNQRNWAQWICNGETEMAYWPSGHYLGSVYCVQTGWDPYSKLTRHSIRGC